MRFCTINTEQQNENRINENYHFYSGFRKSHLFVLCFALLFGVLAGVRRPRGDELAPGDERGCPSRSLAAARPARDKNEDNVDDVDEGTVLSCGKTLYCRPERVARGDSGSGVDEGG